MKSQRLPDSADTTVAALVRRAQTGDADAYHMLVVRYQHDIANSISEHVSDHEVEKVTQETFIKGYRALKSFSNNSTFYRWLNQIAVNTAKCYARPMALKPVNNNLAHNFVHNVAANENNVHELENINDAVALSTNAEPDSDRQTDNNISKAVKSAITGLPAEQQAAIKLKELKGFSYQEIADIMQCSISTVRSRVYLARNAIDSKVKHLLV